MLNDILDGLTQIIYEIWSAIFPTILVVGFYGVVLFFVFCAFFLTKHYLVATLAVVFLSITSLVVRDWTRGWPIFKETNHD